ncbi:MAG: hypothetical protein M1830_006780, partial [Pleopsidium flavum]
SSRRTPKPAEQLLPQRSTRRTPTTARNHLAERPSPYHIPRTEDKEGLPSSRATQSDSQGSVSKKRRITGPASARRLSTIAQTALLEAHSASSGELQSPKTLPKGPQTAAQGENEVAEEAEAPAADHVPDQGRRNRPLLIAKGQGNRKSKGETPTLRATPIVPAQEPAEPMTRSESQPEEQEPGSTSNRQQKSKPRRRKRTSIGKIPKKRKQSMITSGEIEIPHNKLAEEALQAQEQALAVPRRNQTRQRKALATVEEDDDEEDEEQQAEEEHEESNKYVKAAPTFVKQHSQQSKPVRRRTTTSNKQGSRRRGGTADSNVAVAEGSEVTSARKPNRNSISITVHRLSRLQALQTVDDDEDTRNGPPSFPKRNGVNAIDVLAQVCREIIAKAVEKLHEGAETQQNEAGKGEWKRKGKAAIAFGAELDSRLFDMVRLSPKHWTTTGRSQRE